MQVVFGTRLNENQYLFQKMDDYLKALAKQDRQYRLIQEEKNSILNELGQVLDKEQLLLVCRLENCLDGRLRLLTQSQFIVRSLEMLWEKQKQEKTDSSTGISRGKGIRRKRRAMKQKENIAHPKRRRIKRRAV